MILARYVDRCLGIRRPMPGRYFLFDAAPRIRAYRVPHGRWNARCETLETDRITAELTRAAATYSATRGSLRSRRTSRTAAATARRGRRHFHSSRTRRAARRERRELVGIRELRRVELAVPQSSARRVRPPSVAVLPCAASRHGDSASTGIDKPRRFFRNGIDGLRTTTPSRP
jgi:hypothetical protein